MVQISNFRESIQLKAYFPPTSVPGLLRRLLLLLVFCLLFSRYAVCISACMCAKLLQLCPPLCDPMDCSLPGSFVHGIFQARILEWLPCPPSGDLPDPRIKPKSPILQVDPLLPTYKGSPRYTPYMCIILFFTYTMHIAIFFVLLFSLKYVTDSFSCLQEVDSLFLIVAGYFIVWLYPNLYHLLIYYHIKH